MFKKQTKNLFSCCRRILFERRVSRHHVHASLDVHDNEREQQQQQQQRQQQRQRCQRQLFERKSPDCEKFESKVRQQNEKWHKNKNFGQKNRKLWRLCFAKKKLQRGFERLCF